MTVRMRGGVHENLHENLHEWKIFENSVMNASSAGQEIVASDDAQHCRWEGSSIQP
jgi:hypothetical protein